MKCKKCNKEFDAQEPFTGNKTCYCPECFSLLGYSAPPSDIAKDFEMLPRKKRKNTSLDDFKNNKPNKKMFEDED